MGIHISAVPPSNSIQAGGGSVVVDSTGAISVTGQMTVTKADDYAVIAKSGAANASTSFGLARTTTEADLAIAGATNAFILGTAAGDVAWLVRNATQELFFGLFSTTPILRLSPVASNGTGIQITGAAAAGTVALAATAGTASAAGGGISVTTGAGGSTTGASGNLTDATGTTANVTSGTASNTGTITIQSGAPGTATTGTAGNSGAITIQTQPGGAATGAAGIGGASGALTLRSQNGGASTDAASGNGGLAGNVAITGGNGGAATGTATGGAGATVSVTAGNGGNGGTASGLPGNVSIVAGNAGTGGNVAGGTITLTAGDKVGTGVGGYIILNGKAKANGVQINNTWTPASGESAADCWGVVLTNKVDYTAGTSGSSLRSLQIATPVRTAGTNTVNVTAGLQIKTQSMAATVQTGAASAILIEDQTGGSASALYGLEIAGADTAAIWCCSGSNPTDAANGIMFGSSKDTTLYRGAANQLKTDDTLLIATGAVAAGNVALTITPGAHTALTAENQDITLSAHTVILTDGTTIALARSVVFGATTYAGVAAGGTETVTTAIGVEFGLPVQGGNLTITNAPISARFLGNVVLGNVLTPAAGPTNTLTIATGTAPTVNVADACQIFSKDAGGAAGFACPHMIVETNALPLIIAGVAQKADTGQVANPYEGLFEINAADNTVKVYADGGWRTIASGW